MADLIVAFHFGRLTGIDGHSTSQSPLQVKVRRFDPRLRIGCTAGNWSVHVIDFARCLLVGAYGQIPPTLPGWRVGCDANLIERERGPVPVLNDTARFQLRSAEHCPHCQTHCLDRPQRAKIRVSFLSTITKPPRNPHV